MTLINSILARVMPFLPKWVVRPFAKPYVAGEKTQDVLTVVQNLNQDGFSSTIDILGEFIKTKDEALQIRKHYSGK